MYDKIEGGKIVDVQGLQCCLPPVGYVFNVLTKKIEYRGVYQRSEIKEEQYWEIPQLPSWYKDTMQAWDDYDRKKKDEDPDFYDEKLEEFKRQEWDRRLNGFWYKNNGDDVYLTGTHYLYIRWWSIDIGLPKFRIPDLEKAYFMQYCIEDPLCMGMVEVTKRRFGKSFWAGLFLTEYVTRTKMTFGGIQSKTGKDASKFFGKTVVNPFRRLPKFFRPEYDMSLGVNPKSEMRFQKTNVRGKKAESAISKDELGGGIDHQPSDKISYDGQKLHRYVADECGKCFGKGTKIRMWDGSVKNVEDIDNGEFVMGDDSTARLVYGKTNGIENLYKIIPNKGDGFICNESHILTLSVSDRLNYNGKKYVCGDILNISVKEYFSLKDCYRKCVAIYRTGWELPEIKHMISPYMMGVWLGDGSKFDYSITSIDKEIIDCVYSFANEHGLHIRFKEDNISYHVTSHKVGINGITKELRRLNVLKNKHIPEEYLRDSKQNRLQLLAGLIDTDGHVDNYRVSSRIEIIQKNPRLAYGIQELGTSLGFYTSIKPKIATMKRADGSIYRCPVYRLCIYGDIDLIPTKVSRKKIKISRTKNRRNPLKNGFKIEKIGVGEYYGFAVNNNHLFLLEDGTVVHNTVEADVYERHEVIRYCLMDDEGQIIGKALYTTTVEKIESDKDGVQDAFKALWNESNQNSRKENGMTGSGLYRFFMSAKRTRYFDKYGYPDEVRTEKEILSDREGVKDNQRSLFARIRKEPLTIEEAFSIDADSCIFNSFNIASREKDLQENPVYKRGVWFYRDEDTQRVKWRNIQPKEKSFHWQVTPDFPLDERESNKFIIDNGHRVPSQTDLFAIGIDGYSNNQGGERWGSRASAWAGQKPKNGRKKKVFGHLYGRPPEKSILHDQVLLCAEWLSCEAFWEHNSDDYMPYFKERGRYYYLGMYPLILIDPIKIKDTKRHRGVPTTPYSLTKQADLGVSYVETNCEDIDYTELLDDMKIFDPNKRTEFDRTVSFLIWNAAASERQIIQPHKKIPIIKVYNTNSVSMN